MSITVYQLLWKCKSEIVLINPENWLKPVFFASLTWILCCCCWKFFAVEIKTFGIFNFSRRQITFSDVRVNSAIRHLSFKYGCQVPVNYLRRNKPFAFAEPSTQLRKVNVGPNGLYKHAATTTLHLVSSVDKKIIPHIWNSITVQ